MAMDPLPQWVQAIAAIKPDKTSLASKLGDAIDQRVTGKLQLAMVMGPPAQFTWAKATFVQLIENLPASPVLPAGLMAIANAWEASMMASTLVVSPGAYVGSPAPPTLFSVVISSIIMPPSIEAGKAVLQAQLMSAAPIPDPNASPLGPALFSAFSTLIGMVVGLNSVSPPTGPEPLSIPSPVI